MKGRRQCRAINFKRRQTALQGLVKIYRDYIMVDSFNIPVVHTLILLMVKKNLQCLIYPSLFDNFVIEIVQLFVFIVHM